MTAIRSDSAKDNGDSAAGAIAIDTEAIAATAMQASGRNAAAATPGTTDDDSMDPPRTR
jgi:hypothetical protein